MTGRHLDERVRPLHTDSSESLQQPPRKRVVRMRSSRPVESLEQPLHQIGIVELLHDDERPTCIIDLASDGQDIIYLNPSFQRHTLNEGMFLMPDFRQWISMQNVAIPSFLHSDWLWTSTRLRDRFKVISGTRPESPTANSNPFGRAVAKRGQFDWSHFASSSPRPQHINWVLGHNWASTVLGDPLNWSPALRSTFNLVMGSPFPSAFYWGEDLIAIYNEAYVELAGKKHPQLLGNPYSVTWREIWSEIAPIMEKCFRSRESTMKEDDRLLVMRNGFVEECFFTWSLIPIIEEDGTVIGIYNPAFENTRRKVAERMMLTLRELGERAATARDQKAFWQQVLRALETNENETPFAVLYSVYEDLESDTSSQISRNSSHFNSKRCALEGMLGVPQGHHATPLTVEMSSPGDGFARYFSDAARSGKHMLLSLADGTLDPALLEGIQFRGSGEACRDVAICPIQPTTGESVLGFLVMGVNPRRPFDDDYSLFLQLLTRQLATAIASVVLWEEEIKRGLAAAELAARDRMVLSEQLAARTQEIQEIELRFTRMAEFAPVGMIISDHEGRVTYLNEAWYEISRLNRTSRSAEEWMECTNAEDRHLLRDAWQRAVKERLPSSAEFRFKHRWQGPGNVQGETWGLASFFPEKDAQGALKSVFGSLTDISQQKWNESYQSKQREEALELRKAQERFMDMTSHEMRNPLSAILQCADEISNSLGNLREHSNESSTVVDDNIDAAQTIILCAQHQKRIIDDVLTLSKLDSAMLLVTPDDIQPVAVVNRALKMFESELQSKEMKLSFDIRSGFHELAVDWVKADPSRLLQVLINLITNAIKFTTQEPRRTITVSLNASLERPQNAQDISYFPSRMKHPDLTNEEEWGDGQIIYLSFGVQDTGRGLSDSEKKLLFLRFSQTNPRTHVQYGGSGLGLFISRELTELQGGEIGVFSEAGKGSLFHFYVKVRRSEGPPGAAPAEAIKLPLPAPMSRSRQASQAMNGTKILVCEDNVVNAKILKKQLEHQGFSILVANHGGEALEFLRGSNFWTGAEADATVISMILMMPVMNGLEATTRIRELQASGTITRHVPIIAVTANARVEQINKALAAGMDDFVSKPFRIPELIPKMNVMMQRYPAIGTSKY